MGKLAQDGTENGSSSLRSKVFTQIQSDILDGKYSPGDSLVETKLSEELGVSRTPVREAMRQLELEGLVQSIPNKGTLVKGVSPQDIKDIYTIRMRIEGLAARWAAEKITEEELLELQEALELEEFYTVKNDSGHLLRFDSKFHDIIFNASKSPPLRNMLQNFHLYIQHARTISMESPNRAQKMLDEHRAILRAIENKDADSAERLTTEHIKNARDNLLKLTEK